MIFAMRAVLAHRPGGGLVIAVFSTMLVVVWGAAAAWSCIVYAFQDAEGCISHLVVTI